MPDCRQSTALSAECRALVHGIRRLAAEAEALAAVVPNDHDTLRGFLEVLAFDHLPAAARVLADHGDDA